MFGKCAFVLDGCAKWRYLKVLKICPHEDKRDMQWVLISILKLLDSLSKAVQSQQPLKCVAVSSGVCVCVCKPPRRPQDVAVDFQDVQHSNIFYGLSHFLSLTHTHLIFHALWLTYMSATWAHESVCEVGSTSRQLIPFKDGWMDVCTQVCGWISTLNCCMYLKLRILE